MTSVTWEKFKSSTKDQKPAMKGGSAGVYFEDYDRHDGYWRYTWTNFTLDSNPKFVEVYNMGYDE